MKNFDPPKTRIALFTLAVTVLAPLFSSGCGVNPSFTSSNSQKLPDNVVGPNSPVPTPTPTVCVPFTGPSDPGTSQNGLTASLTYIPSNSIIIEGVPDASSPYDCGADGDGQKCAAGTDPATGLAVGEYPLLEACWWGSSSCSPDLLSTQAMMSGQPYVQDENVTVVLSNLNFPTQEFSIGFGESSGQTLKDVNGNTLVEYFALHIDSSIMLNPTDAEGDYQFALVSDDGATLDANLSGGGMTNLINAGTTHPNELVAAAGTVHLVPGVPLPIHVEYYQGPRTEIALMLLWRRNPASLSEPLSGVIEPTATSSSPAYYSTKGAGTQAYTQDGWSPVPSQNFYLPDGQVNNCY